MINSEHTQRRKIDRILAERKKLSRIADERSLNSVIQSVIDTAEKMTDSRIGFLCCLADDHKGISLQSYSTMSEKILPQTQNTASGIAQTEVWQECLVEKKSIICNDFNEHNQSIREKTALPFFRSLLIPVIRGQQVVAVLGIGNKPTPYDTEDVDNISELSDLCWDIIACKQVTAPNTTFHQPSTKLENNQQCPQLKMESKYCKLIENLNDAVFLVKNTGPELSNFSEINQEAVNRYGYTREEFQNMNALSLVAPEYLKSANIEKQFKILNTERKVIYESIHISKNGERFPVECSGTIIELEGDSYILGTVRDISGRKQAEEQQQKTESILQLITDNISDVVWMFDLKEQRYSYISPSVEQMRGHSPEQAMGMSMEETLTPDSYQKALKRISLLVASPETINKNLEIIELQQCHADGRVLDIEIAARLIRDAEGNPASLAGITRDITARKIAEKKLQEEKEKFRSLFEHITDYVLILKAHNNDLVITDMSESACHYHGYTRNELLGQSISFLDLTGYNEKQKRESLRFLQSGQTYPFETVHRRKDGTTFPVGAAIKQIEIDGEPHLFAIEHDLTMRKKAEAERNELEQQLRQKYKMEAVGLMAGGIAHNFNNNLAIILGNLELIKMRTSADAKLGEYLDNATIGVHRSRTLVQQIMTYSRQNTHRKTPIQPALVIEETCKLLRSTMPTSVELEFHSSSLPEMAIQADSTRIQEALLNLCNNAVHAMNEKGTLTISLHTTHLDMADIPAQFDCQPGLFAELTIKDTGSGMTPEIIDKIFDPFFTTKDVDEGTGMGLATVLGIVEQHEGLIKVASEPGEGTTFALYFPVAEAGHQQPDLQAVSSLPRGSERLLLIDDDKMLAHVNATMLSEMGYQVEVENSSVKALERFRNEGNPFDLVITDQTMPEITGAELAQEIRNLYPDLPIILCTGYSNKITDKDAERLGLAAFCMKPLDMPELLKIVRSALDGRK